MGWWKAALFVLAVLPAQGFAQEVRTLEPGQASPPARIAEAAWLEGRWFGEGLGGQVEDNYSAPADGQIVGYFRLLKDGKAGFYEFLTIAEREGSLVYRLKHFNPDGSAWEDKERWIEFPLVAAEEGKLFFNGLTLERTGPDTLSAHLRLQDRATGRRWVETFRYKRAP